jgi:hypothetical protein
MSLLCLYCCSRDGALFTIDDLKPCCHTPNWIAFITTFASIALIVADSLAFNINALWIGGAGTALIIIVPWFGPPNYFNKLTFVPSQVVIGIAYIVYLPAMILSGYGVYNQITVGRAGYWIVAGSLCMFSQVLILIALRIQKSNPVVAPLPIAQPAPPVPAPVAQSQAPTTITICPGTVTTITTNYLPTSTVPKATKVASPPPELVEEE